MTQLETSVNFFRAQKIKETKIKLFTVSTKNWVTFEVNTDPTDNDILSGESCVAYSVPPGRFAVQVDLRRGGDVAFREALDKTSLSSIWKVIGSWCSTYMGRGVWVLHFRSQSDLPRLSKGSHNGLRVLGYKTPVTSPGSIDARTGALVTWGPRGARSFDVVAPRVIERRFVRFAKLGGQSLLVRQSARLRLFDPSGSQHETFARMAVQSVFDAFQAVGNEYLDAITDAVVELSTLDHLAAIRLVEEKKEEVLNGSI